MNQKELVDQIANQAEDNLAGRIKERVREMSLSCGGCKFSDQLVLLIAGQPLQLPLFRCKHPKSQYKSIWLREDGSCTKQECDEEKLKRLEQIITQNQRTAEQMKQRILTPQNSKLIH